MPTARLRAITCLALPIVVCLLPPATVVFGQAQLQEKDSGGRVRYQESSTVEVARDIDYARYGERALRLDLYLPAERGAEPIPGIVVIRGGGWRAGDKEGFAAIADALARRGFAAASIEYRPSGEATWPAALNDAKAAVRWMRANASAHGIDGDAIGAIGGSAGAHLVALLATTHRMDELDGEGGNPDESNRIQAAVAMAVPADLSTFAPARAEAAAEDSSIVRFLGASPMQDPDLWKLASPIHHVHAKAAPMLLIHSDSDRAVPHTQSRSLRRRYAKAGATAELVTMKRAPHAFWNWTRWFDDTMDEAAVFFDRHLR